MTSGQFSSQLDRPSGTWSIVNIFLSTFSVGNLSSPLGGSASVIILSNVFANFIRLLTHNSFTSRE